jgi:hypothetical protein
VALVTFAAAGRTAPANLSAFILVGGRRGGHLMVGPCSSFDNSRPRAPRSQALLSGHRRRTLIETIRAQWLATAARFRWREPAAKRCPSGGGTSSASANYRARGL